MDSWFTNEKNSSKFDATLAEEVETQPAFSTNCAKCGTHTRDHPELRGWWPAINGKFCSEKSDPRIYGNEVLTWYCKRCYVEENSHIVVRLIRNLLT